VNGSSLLALLTLASLAGCSADVPNKGRGSPPPLGGFDNAAGTSSAGPTPAEAGIGPGAIDNASGLVDAAAATSGRDAGADLSEGEKCGEHHFDLERKPAELLLVLDRSASMKDAPDGASDATTKWDLVVPAVNQVISETDTTISWGLKTFPEGDGDECVATGVTSHIDVELTALNAARVTAAVTATTPEGNGTPTGDAVTQGAMYLQSLTDSNPKYILLATDGEPSCPKPSDSAHAFAVESVGKAAAAGIHTFVLGVSTTKKSATGVLNDMAIAGMEPRISDPNPLLQRFYLANSKDELVNSLKLITGQISGCTFSWDRPPPVPDNIAVKVGGVKAPHDPNDGWEYLGDDHRSIEVRGRWCEEIKTTASNLVEIVFGCPNVEIL
jgi:hypothetical protein